MTHLRDRHVLILGLGDSGLAMARWCARQGAARITVADTREAPPQAARLAADVPAAVPAFGAFTPALLEGAQLVLKSPGLSPLAPEIAALLDAAAERGVLVQGELALFARALADLKADHGYAPKLLAITGTNGKTTTTSMTAQLVERTGRRVGLAGNIGPTLLDTLSAARALEARPEAAAGPDAPPPAEAAVAVEGASADTATAVADEATAPAAEAQPEAPEAPEAAEGGHAATEAAPAPEDATPADEPTGGGPPPHLIPPPPPGPVFDHLPEVWVLELSSFQLDGVTGFEPTAATVLNITQDHLDWHGDMAAYAAAKARIFGRGGILVINRDEPAVEALVPEPQVIKPATRGARTQTIHRQVVRFGLDAPQRPGDFGLVTENGMAWLVRAHPADETQAGGRRKKGAVVEEEILLQRLMPADALRIRGRHNASNALAALALATAAGLPLAPMLHGLREYAGEPHRVEYVTTVGGIEAFDDSKGTNVGATVAALNGLGADKSPSRLVLILGGDGKGQDFTPLAAPLARHARAVALIGRDAEAIEAAVGAACADAGVPLAHFGRGEDALPQAVTWAFGQARGSDAVLLSPACASLDMFRNYGHRAQVFVDAVQALAADRGEFA